MGEAAPSVRTWVTGLVREKGTLVPFVLLYMVGLGAMAGWEGNTEFVMYTVVMVVLIVLVLWADRRVRFSKPVLWGLAVWGLLHMAGGTIKVGTAEDGTRLVLYGLRVAEWMPRYDQVVHAFGFCMATMASWEALCAGVRPIGRLRATPGLAFGAMLMGMGLGALNEVVEFTAVLLLPHTNVGGYINTGWDLVSNMAGAGIAAVVLWARDLKSEI